MRSVGLRMDVARGEGRVYHSMALLEAPRRDGDIKQEKAAASQCFGVCWD